MRPKIPADGGQALGSNPFAALNLGPLPEAPARPMAPVPEKETPPARRGLAHLRIEKSGRGGKTVTVLFGPGVEQLPEPERATLLRALKAALGTGGAIGAAGTLEVQGDERPRVAEWLRRAGFSCKG